MGDYLLLMCKCDPSLFILKCDRCWSYGDLMSVLSSRFGGIAPDGIRACYSAGGYERILLLNDDDLRNLFLFCDANSLNCVDLFIEVERSVTSSNLLRTEDRSCSSEGRLSAISSEGCGSSSNLLSSSWSSGLVSVGQVFENGFPEFRDALLKFSIHQGFEYVYVKNNSIKVHAVCSLKAKTGCDWCVVATSSNVSTFVTIKKLNTQHSCGVVKAQTIGGRMSSNFVAELLVDKVKCKPDYSGKDVVSHLKFDYGLDISYKKAWRALEKAKSLIFGDEVLSFNSLRHYLDASSSVNSGSHMVLDVSEDSNRFRRVFVSFSACISGFNHCRPVLCLDGTFLKGRFKGILLVATGKDGDQGLFPLAFAIVDSETVDNWHWFLIELKRVLDDGRVINFISDRNFGLVDGISSVFPHCHHFFCLFHLKNNLRDRYSRRWHSVQFRDHIVRLFGDCAEEHNESVFLEKFKVLNDVGGEIITDFLKDLPLHQWTNAFSHGCRYGDMSSNAAESFNSWIRDIRGLPITHLIDNLRLKLMKWWVNRRDSSNFWNGVLCPYVLQKVNNSLQIGKSWVVNKSSNDIYEVCSSSTRVVDVVKRTCTCYAWQHNGFPCVHACVAVCKNSSLRIEDVIEDYFYVANYRKSYEGVIHPVESNFMSDVGVVDGVEILPPSTKRQAGRPRKKRFKSRGEFTKSIRCSRCGKLGNHTRRTCKEPLL